MGFPILVRWHLYIESGPWAVGDSIWHHGFVSTLIQVMACYLSMVLPLPGPMVLPLPGPMVLPLPGPIVDWTVMKKTEWKLKQNMNLFIQEITLILERSSAKCWPFPLVLNMLNGNGQCHKQSYNAFIQYCLFHYAVRFIDCFETDMLISISCPGWYNKIGSDSVNIPYKLNLIMKTLV